MTERQRPPGRAQAGMTLIEVMVALLIFTIGLVGLVGLQARATQYSIGAEDSSRASLLANEIVAQMWTARTINLPSADVAAWNLRVANSAVAGLPNGVGEVEVTGNVATVRVTWRPPRKPTGVTSRYETQVVLP